MTEEKSDDFAAFEARVQTGEAPADPPAGDTPETATEQEATEAVEVEADQPDTEAAEGEDDPHDEDKSRNKPPSKRIAELTRNWREAERREAEALRRIEELTAPKPETPAPQAKPDENEPKPEDFELGEFDPGYIAAFSKYHARQEWKALEAERSEKAAREATQQEVQQLQTAYNERAAELASEIPDFDEVVTLGAQNGEWPCTEVMGLALLDSEQGPRVAHYLATHKAEAVKIAQMHPLKQAREMGRLEAKFLTTTSPQPKVTSAPPPPDSRTRGASGRFEPDISSFAAFEKAADRSLGRK